MGGADIVADVIKRALWLAGAAVLVAVVALGVLGLLWAQEFQSLARSGKADAASGVKYLEEKQTEPAIMAFRKSADEFGRARAQLGPEWLRTLPWLGRQLDVADDLATIGLEAATAGASAAQLLSEADADSGADRINELVKLAGPHLDAALVSLVAVAERSERLSTEGLVPQLAEAVTEAQEELAPMRILLQRAPALLELERRLFGKQHRFLVLSQNSAQLRPTGGFPGTYGLVEIGPDGFRLTEFADIYTLPKDTLDLPIPDGGQVNQRHFYLRNANAWLDFPTSANVVLQLWENMGQPQIDGIVAIDIPTIRDLLKVFGPISVPESDEPLTAKNVMEQLSYVVSIEHSGKTYQERKDAVISLAKAVVERITHLGGDEFLPTMTSLANSANEKHIQLFFSDPEAQAAIIAVGWSGAIDPPTDTTDVVAVSNSVVARPAKANLGVSKSLDYLVRLEADGSAETRLRLKYKKSFDSPLGDLQKWLVNYARVHRAPGTTKAASGGTKAVETLSETVGLPTFGHQFRLDRGKSTTVELRTRVPEALRSGVAAPVVGGPAVGRPNGSVEASHYRLLIARQADLVDTAVTVTVQVPAGWKVVGAAAWFRASGTALETSGGDTEVTLTTRLKQDLVLDVNLTRG